MADAIASTRSKVYARRFQEHRQEYQDYLPLTERIEEELRQDVEDVKAQEGWDAETRRGVEEWLGDRDSIWRALRRNRYDEAKTHASLLSILSERVSRQLHAPVPVTDMSDSPLFFVLPLPQFTDRLARPVVVITLCQVTRDENGSLEEMKEWTWWALEMVRRVLRDWWVKGAWGESGNKHRARVRKRGYGGEGCVLVVDASGASYRNLEVELLPTLLSVGHNNFSGMIEAVFVVNAGWTHRSMWNVVKRVLPRAALEKFSFLDSPAAIDEVFDLHHLPRAYGGLDPWAFDSSQNSVLLHYARPSILPESSTSSCDSGPSRPPSHSASFASIADVYYTAHNTPAQSRHASRRGSFATGPGLREGLRMTGMPDGSSRLQRSRSASVLASQRKRSAPPTPPASEHSVQGASARSPFEEEFARGPTSQPPSRRSSRHSSSGSTPLQRIKSLSNFHLYLSPSRLAPAALLSDSEDETPPVPPPRRTLQPLMLDPEETIRAKSPMTLADRRARPGLRIKGISGPLGDEETVRSYSDRLQLHHAKALQAYRAAHEQGSSTTSEDTTPRAISITPTVQQPQVTPGIEPSPSPSPILSPISPEGVMPSSDQVETIPHDNHAQPVSAFSTTNPWFGYPAVRVPDSSHPGNSVLRPRYPRNRKRDLVKTLLFLFMLRLQAWRDAFERFLGLNNLHGWTPSAAGTVAKMVTPSEGLLRAAEGPSKALLRSNPWDRDWVWMVIGFLLLRGTWTRVLSAPLEALGLEGVRDMLGLV